jgi:hypothetical protein
MACDFDVLDLVWSHFSADVESFIENERRHDDFLILTFY